MKKLLRCIPQKVPYIVLCLFLAGVLGFVVNIRIKAKSIGSFLGEAAGSDAGRVMGSFEALTDYRDAYAEGKEEGLSARDTTAEVANKIYELNKLEVLVAGVKLKNVHSIGEGENQEYAALYLLKGDAVFTVDFSEAEIQSEGGRISVMLPEPEMDLIIDQRKINKAAEYQKYFFSGSAEDGFDAFLASMNEMDSQTKETLVNYDVLMAAAKDSAIKQVEQLLRAVSVPEPDVEIEFRKEGQTTDTASENGAKAFD